MIKKRLKYQWKENIKPLALFFLAGLFASAGFETAKHLIPKKPAEYRICIKDSVGDYMCQTNKSN